MAFQAAMDLTRRMRPRHVEQDLSDMLVLVPDLVDDLLSAVDQPLKVLKCPSSGKDFIVCDYNRDGDSYRSPWSNQYVPPLEDGIVPSEEIRSLELCALEAFDQYRALYYDGGVSSTYFWDNEGGFACCIAIHKDCPTSPVPMPENADPAQAAVTSGTWNSIHVIEAKVSDAEKRAKYKLTTTVMLSLDASYQGKSSEFDLSGSLTRTMEREKSFSDKTSHVANMGEMVEEMEGRMRDALYEVYFGKTKEVVRAIRTPEDERRNMQMNLMAEMMKRKTT
mmetsp:Transcript_7477/g.25490  ORF Transcript_7477/g.25490 Transcript_7477/m.25490 type:complete len:279 (+) Transcript_7477:2-838(+)